METPNEIETLIYEDLEKIDPEIRAWISERLIKPKRIELANSPDEKHHGLYWLVTDHSGNKDTSYRIVFDDRTKQFGLEMTTATGVQLYMGPSGSFADTANNL